MRLHIVTIACVISAWPLVFYPSKCHGEDIGEERAEKVGASLIGTLAPSVEIQLLDGQKLQLSSLLGRKPIYLKFWATWCIPCREQMPHLQTVYQSSGDKLEVIAINVGINESLESVQAFRTKINSTVPVAIDFDGSIARAFELAVTPQHVVIDRDGIIRHVGHLVTDELDRLLASLAQSEATAPSNVPKQAMSRNDEENDAETDSLQLLDGATFQLGRAIDEKPTVLFFFATWCDWYLEETLPASSSKCIRFQENVSELYKHYGDRFDWIGIAQSLWTNADDLREYQTRLAVGYPLALDEGGRWFAKYGIRDVPTVVVLDSTGDVLSIVADDVAQLNSILSEH